jgi:hypothetical protein
VKLVLALIVIAGGVAHASPPGETPPLESVVYDAKSETTATVLTLAGIATPFALTYLLYEPDTDNPMYASVGMMTGLFMPAIGHWYTRRVGTYGILMRFGALVAFGVGVQYLDDADRCARGEQVPDGCFASDRAMGRASVGLGLATWAGSWVYDVWSARREVRRRNARKTIQILPMAAQGTTGFAIGGAF